MHFHAAVNEAFNEAHAITSLQVWRPADLFKKEILLFRQKIIFQISEHLRNG